MKNDILKSVEDAIRAAKLLKSDEAILFIEQVAEAIAVAYANRGKLLIAGNGGSLCDAMHFAEELTGYFRKKRRAFPAIALCDPAHMSCVANDSDFESVFARSVEAYGQEGDILVVLSTSGNSANIVHAVEMAKRLGLLTVAFLGKSGGQLKDQCDYEWVVSGFDYSDRIQEAHMAAIHIIIEMVERRLIYAPAENNLLTAANV
ncbi:MAG: SIS domain-containing protein [Simkaniaceae bacterium]|nr:SIS domain-containing protein [Simkaniaceae bacterium]